MRTRGAVCHWRTGPIPGRPFHRCRLRTLESVGRTASRPALRAYQTGKAKTPCGGKWAISVGHDDLRLKGTSMVTHILPGGLRYSYGHNVPRNYTWRGFSSVTSQSPTLSASAARSNALRLPTVSLCPCAILFDGDAALAAASDYVLAELSG